MSWLQTRLKTSPDPRIQTFEGGRIRTFIVDVTATGELTDFKLPGGTFAWEIKNEGDVDLLLKVNNVNFIIKGFEVGRLPDKQEFQGVPYIERDDEIQSLTFDTGPGPSETRAVIFFHRVDRQQS